MKKIILFCSLYLLPSINAHIIYNIKDAPECYLKKCTSLQKKITALEQKKDSLLDAIAHNQELIDLEQAYQTLKTNIQEHALYKQKEYYKRCHTFITKLLQYNQTIMQPHILNELDVLLPLIQSHETDMIISMLLHERVHLLELADQFFALHTIQKNLHTFEYTCSEQIKNLTQKLNSLDFYQQLKENREIYNNHPLVQDLSKIEYDLWKLQQEMLIKLLKQKDYIHYLYTKQKETDITIDLL